MKKYIYPKQAVVPASVAIEAIKELSTTVGDLVQDNKRLAEQNVHFERAYKLLIKEIDTQDNN